MSGGRANGTSPTGSSSGALATRTLAVGQRCVCSMSAGGTLPGTSMDAMRGIGARGSPLGSTAPMVGSGSGVAATPNNDGVRARVRVARPPSR